MDVLVAPAAPGAFGPLPNGVPIAARSEQRDREAQRRLDKRTQMRRDPTMIRNAAAMRERKRQREAVQEQHRENRLGLDAPRANDVQALQNLLAQGHIKMELVENIPPGWLLFSEAGLGVAMTPDQIAQHRRIRADAVAAGMSAMVPALAPWHACGILKFPPVVGMLRSIGGDRFVNFFGDPNMERWAIEVPLAKALGLFVAGWVLPDPIIDPDWNAGGVGPYLAYVPDTDDAAGVPIVDPQVEAAESERRQSYADYLRERLAQPGTYEADQQLALPPPSAAEQGAGELPPSMAAGNPGLEPILEEQAFPPENLMQHWARKIINLALALGPPPAAVAQFQERVRGLMRSLTDAYGYGDDGRITTLRLELGVFYEEMADEWPLARSKGGDSTTFNVRELLYDKVNELMAATVAALVSSQSPRYSPQSPDYSPQSPRYSPDSALPDAPADLAPEAPADGSDTLVAEPVVQEPEVADPPPPPGLSAQQVQINTVQRAAVERKPPPSAYNSLLEYQQSNVYKAGVRKVESGEIGDFNGAHAALVPTLHQRSQYFYVHTEAFDIEQRVAGLYGDDSNLVRNKRYTMNDDTYFATSVFKQSYDETVEISPPPLTPPLYKTLRVWGVAADDPQSMGLFGHHQMAHMYKHMVEEGHVMFSVNKDKALQFFPSDLCCSNVWWWHAKTEYLPSSLRWHLIGSGSFNKAYRLCRSSGTELPDHFLFLPPTRIAYDMTLSQADLKGAFAPTKQNGLLYRIAYSRGLAGDPYGINRPLRELMIAGYAASKGLGPKIFAAYIVPGGRNDCYIPHMRMNPGDPDEQMASPLHRPAVHPDRRVFEAGKKPYAPWFKDPVAWSDIVRSGTEVYTPLKDWSLPTTKRGEWYSMVVIMESFAGDMKHLRVRNDTQRDMVVDKLFKCFEQMGRAGILHCDIKPANMVQRTWRSGAAASAPSTPEWDGLEIRPIDFDPYFVKITPWLPWEVIALVNATQYFAILTCHPGYPDQGLRIPAIPRLRALYDTCNTRYPTGLAAAFRALKPDFSPTAGPAVFNGNRAMRGDMPFGIFNMLADEFEAARAFRKWVDNYMRGQCPDYAWTDRGTPKEAGMLARLIAFILYEDASKAKVATPDNPVVPFDAPAGGAPDGIWGDDTVLGQMGALRLEPENAAAA